MKGGQFTMEVEVLITAHNGSTTLLNKRLEMPSTPRVGEIISFNEKMDNTYDFIVYDVRYDESNNFTPLLYCESFYAHGGHSRDFYLKQSGYLPNDD